MIAEIKQIFYKLWRLRQQMSALFGVGIVLLGVIASLPVYDWLTGANYQLDDQALSVVGPAKDDLAHKLVFNNKDNLYEFNADAKKSASDTPADIAKRLQKNVTGDSANKGLYSLDVSPDVRQGMTIYDNNSELSFKMIPQFSAMDGRKVQDRLVYPMSDGVKAVYTMKNNGLKEDIIFSSSPHGGTASYSYKLQLPSTLQARIQTDGSLGVYSADPNLFGNISFGSDADKVKVESARENAPKTHLVFGVPSPKIVTKNGTVHSAQARFTLEKDTLTVTAIHLETIHSAFSIDPSVVVTSSSDFVSGNDDGNIDFPTDQITRGKLTGGTLNTTWNTVASLPAALDQAGGVVSDGYIYIIGGYNGSVNLSSVYYAQILADGTLGAWATAPSLPQIVTRMGAASYSGYIYSIGGYSSAVIANVYYSKIGSAGAPAAWASTTSLPQVTQSMMATAYQGYVYVIGGNSGSAGYTSVYYAVINADGTLGAWTSTASLPITNSDANATAYNGYIYTVGGYNGSAVVATVQHARINSNGTLGSWVAVTSLPTALENASSAIYKGYLYEMAGDAGSAGNAIVRYAQINSDGTIGTWVATTSLPLAHSFTTSVIYGGNIYKIGGITPSFVATVYQNSILPAGTNGGWATTTASPTITSKGKTYGRYGHTSVVYDGYIYIMGGYQNGVGISETWYAPISVNGTVGAWTASTSLPTALYYHASVIYNGYVYIIGGYNGTASTSTVYYASLSPTGGIGTWVTNATSFVNIRSSLSAVAYKGFLYIMGGYVGTTDYADVQYAPINANGSIGAWTATTSFTTGRDSASAVAMNGYLYIAGGWNGTTQFADTQYAPINANGSIGAWTATTSLNTARHGAISGSSEGCMYIGGGGIGGADTATVEFSCMNSNGSLSTWKFGSPFTTAREYAAGVISNGNFYFTGGYDGTTVYYSDTQYSSINNGGVAALSSWSTTTALPETRNSSAAVASNGYLYIIGGSGPSGNLNTVYDAPINTDGSLGTWAVTSSFTTPRNSLAAVAYNGYVYVLGGDNGTLFNDVQYAPINTDGSLGTWAVTSSFTTPRSGHTAVASNGYIYIIGGKNTSYLNDVQYATINSNGTLSAWTATTSFTTARWGHASLINGNYLYVLGGNNGTYLSDVQYAPINSNGTIGTWTGTTAMTTPRYGASAYVANGSMYIAGGEDATPTPLATVQYASVSADGSIGEWNGTASLGAARYNHAAVGYDGNLYVLGGYNTASIGTVEYASLKTIMRTGRYTKLIDLGSVTTLSNISYTGSLSNGKAAIQFKYAGTNAIFSSWTPATTLTGPCGVSISARYVLIGIKLDDSRNGALIDSANAGSAIQDLTLDYGIAAPTGVNPAARLRAGKFFSTSGSLQPLDTLKTIGGC